MQTRFRQNITTGDPNRNLHEDSVLPGGGARTVFPDKAKYVQYQSHSKGVMQTQDEAALTSGADHEGN